MGFRYVVLLLVSLFCLSFQLEMPVPELALGNTTLGQTRRCLEKTDQISEGSQGPTSSRTQLKIDGLVRNVCFLESS